MNDECIFGSLKLRNLKYSVSAHNPLDYTLSQLAQNDDSAREPYYTASLSDDESIG